MDIGSGIAEEASYSCGRILVKRLDGDDPVSLSLSAGGRETVSRSDRGRTPAFVSCVRRRREGLVILHSEDVAGVHGIAGR